MIAIKVLPVLYQNCPEFTGAAISAQTINTEHNAELWEILDSYCVEYKHTHSLENIKTNPAIKATRDIYKKLGKDPNRYRPSAEALCRRIIRGLPLYRINTLVDIINLTSIKTGYSIGGFDADKISGNVLTLDTGKDSDHFEAIGRGLLNIDGLPVYRDSAGGIGTPTSDNERTKLALETQNLLTIINAYDGKQNLEKSVEEMCSLLKRFASAQDIIVSYF